jgi:farnesyl-diphosphate farnesyltransferase
VKKTLPPSSVVSLAELHRLARPVSRSFSLSLQLLPRPLAHPITLAYLLARLSDTVADAPAPFAPERLDLLRRWQDNPDSVEGNETGFPHTARPAEADLWRAWPFLRQALSASPIREEILRVWQRILQGQCFDVERALAGTESSPLPWPDLIEYTDQVAGCVGSFWNRVGLQLLPPWSAADPDFLERAGRAYGRALQLVNICRDAAADKQQGRCYLTPADRGHALDTLTEGLRQGRQVADSLVSWRPRLATALPGTLATAMLPALREGRAIRLSRMSVYRCLVWAIFKLGRKSHLLGKK